MMTVAVSSLEVGNKITVDDKITGGDEITDGDKMTVAVEGIIFVRNVIMSVLGLNLGYTMKYGLSSWAQIIFHHISLVSS